jgi:GGDEF domain-containing protein
MHGDNFSFNDNELTVRTRNIDQFIQEHTSQLSEPHLLILSGNNPVEYAPLFPQQSLLIGRSPAADIRIQDEGISRTHSRIENRVDGVYVIDLNSSNGTFVNGARIVESRLSSGDIIQVGRETTIQLVWKKPEASDDRKRCYALVAHDEVTGTRSWEYFMDVFSWEFAYHKSKCATLSLVLLHLDGIQRIREIRGEAASTMVLRCFGEGLIQHLGPNVLIGRKEEATFGILFRCTDEQEALSRFTEGVSSLEYRALDICPEVKSLDVYFGLCTETGECFSEKEKMIARAEERLQTSCMILGSNSVN